MVYHKAEAKVVQELKDIAHRLRIDSITSTQASKSGHLTSCASIAEIMSVLLFHQMRHKLSAPRNPAPDRFILSKGHAAPILYAAWAVADLDNLRKLDSDLEGHPTPRLNFIDIGTGSLGQGVAVAAGMGYVGKNFNKSDFRNYVFVGDGESAEGICMGIAPFCLGQSEPTSLQHQMKTYRKRLEAFGFHAIVVDGHDVEELLKAFWEAQNTKGKPIALIAKTYNGKFFSKIEDEENWHGKPLGNESEAVIKHLKVLIKNHGAIQIQLPSPKTTVLNVDIKNIKLASPPSYKLGEQVATRLAYGTALAKIAVSNPRVIALDGDTKNSTYSDKLKKAFPDRYIEVLHCRTKFGWSRDQSRLP